MIGTALNAVGILAGGTAGLAWRRETSGPTQRQVKLFLGVGLALVGVLSAWRGIRGSDGLILHRGMVVLLALVAGRFTGGLLKVQHRFNRVGRDAAERFRRAQSDAAPRFSDGFLTCTVLFCIEPLALPGAMQDGLRGDWWPLAAKAVMDGISTATFARVFGWGALAAALPVTAYQGTVSLLARGATLRWEADWLLDPLYATCAIMVFTVALVILKVRRVELADYLPSLAFAPLIAWLLR